MGNVVSNDGDSRVFNSTEQTEALSTLTRAILICGLISGPFYLIVGLIQALTRPGFDLVRHDLSLLANGDLGWIQIANLIVTGLLVIVGALGMRQVLRGSRGGTWGPLLLGLYGLGLIGSGIFAADPAFGFPPGTPANANTISWHGLLHILCGAIGFLGLIAACFVLARRFAGQRARGWAIYSVATGVLFFAAFVGIATGSGQSWSVIGFWIGVIAAWAWLSLLMARLLRRQGARKIPDKGLQKVHLEQRAASTRNEDPPF